MKTEYPTGGAILTMVTAQGEAETISNWVAERLQKTVVELKRPGGAEVVIEIYFANTLEAEIASRALSSFPVRNLSVREYAAEEWAESWKKHFKPMDIGRRLRVVPPWLTRSEVGEQFPVRRALQLGERSEDRETGTEIGDQASGVREEKIEIVINPGLSFGTGNHFTTRFCLEQLDRFVPESGAKTMLDIGTGSGILAISSIKLGAKQAIGVDFDELCVEQSIKNAAANGVAEKTTFFQHDITNGWPPAVPGFREAGDPSCDNRPLRKEIIDFLVDTKQYDIVCANIYSSLLIDNAATLLRVAGKYLLLTGIREVELDGVADTFVRLGGREVVRDCDREWSGLVIEV